MAGSGGSAEAGNISVFVFSNESLENTKWSVGKKALETISINVFLFFFQLSSQYQRPLNTRCIISDCCLGMSIFTQYHAMKKKNHIIQSQVVVQKDVSNFPASDRAQDAASGQSPPGWRCWVLLDEIQAPARDPRTLLSNILKYTVVHFQLFHQEVKSASLFLLCRRVRTPNLLFLFLESTMKRRVQLLRVSCLNILFDLNSCVFVTNLHRKVVSGTFCEHFSVKVLISTKDFGKTLFFLRSKPGPLQVSDLINKRKVKTTGK